MSKTDKTLAKCNELIEKLNEIKKALKDVNQFPARKPTPALGAGWSQDPGTGAFHHSHHGIISTSKRPDGQYDIKHGGRSVGRVGDIGEAGARISKYVKMLDPNDPSPSTHKNPMSMTTKSEDDVEKGNYGKMKDLNNKTVSQYVPADNAKRKVSNVGEAPALGANKNVKSYTGRATAQKEKAGPAGPVKQFTPAQIAAANEARNLKKNAEDGDPWMNHASIPNADEEIVKLKKTNPVDKAENIMSNQLANMMAGRAMLGNPPKQPTDEEMFGRLVPSEEEIQKAEASWNNKLNWLEEATRPIASRFNSPEEEAAYWDSIKVHGSSRDDFGF